MPALTLHMEDSNWFSWWASRSAVALRVRSQAALSWASISNRSAWTALSFQRGLSYSIVTPCLASVSRVNSKAARAMPMALAATMGRVASKVFMAPLKPLLPRPLCTSASPSKFSAGTRQLSRIMPAVSLARMPNFSSTLTMIAPGVPDSTTKGFIPARPALLSTVAQTTTRPSDSSSANLPLVQKIF